jgi:hypothetical protein
MNNSVSRRVTNALGAPMLVGGVLVGSAAAIPPAVAAAAPVSTAILPDASTAGMPIVSIIPAPSPSAAAQSNPFIPAGLWGPTPNASFINSQ